MIFFIWFYGSAIKADNSSCSSGSQSWRDLYPPPQKPCRFPLVPFLRQVAPLTFDTNELHRQNLISPWTFAPYPIVHLKILELFLQYGGNFDNT